CKATVGDDGNCTTSAMCTNGSCLAGHCQKSRDGSNTSPIGDSCTTSNDCKTGSFCEIPGNIDGLQSDAGALTGTTGTCAPSKNGIETCDAGTAHQCQGKCSSAGNCTPSCSFPN
ncbi:MAG: hypothetical protein ABI551_03565, partial [Polyangiaceae bacterium]